jgi:hypothetical protein
MRYKVAVPEQHQDKANQLAMALGLSLNDKNTYTELKYTDVDGNLYAVASFIASSATASKVDAPLERPAWDAENEDIDMELAEHAKSLVAMDVASVNTVSFNNNDNALVAIEQLGLTRYVEPEPELDDEFNYTDETEVVL